MKTINKILLVILAFLGISCQKDYEFNEDIVQEYVTTSFGNKANLMQVNGWMSFLDLSRGVESRTWTFPEGVAINLDSTEVTTSASENLKVSFIVPGVHKISLKQIFCKEIETEDGLTNEKEQFVEVTVLDSVRASFTALCRETGAEINLASGAKNELQGGHHIDFTVTSTGAPNKNVFTFVSEDGKAETVEAVDGIASYQFYSPGLYEVTLESSSDFGRSSIKYTELVNVIASEDPVDFIGAERLSSNTIGLKFSRAMKDASDCPVNAFSLNITNGENMIPVVANIQSVSTDVNIVKLVLDTDIYNTDNITVSYDASVGNLITLDYVYATNFISEPESFDFKMSNLLKEAGYDVGFENCTVEDWDKVSWGATLWDDYKLSMVNDNAHSGNGVAYAEISAGKGMIMGCDTKVAGGYAIPVETNVDYLLSMWINVQELDGTPVNGIYPNITFDFAIDTKWSTGVWFNNDFVKGQWVNVTCKMSSSKAGDSGIIIRATNEKSSSALNFYFDDISLTKIEKRP